MTETQTLRYCTWSSYFRYSSLFSMKGQWIQKSNKLYYCNIWKGAHSPKPLVAGDVVILLQAVSDSNSSFFSCGPFTLFVKSRKICLHCTKRASNIPLVFHHIFWKEKMQIIRTGKTNMALVIAVAITASSEVYSVFLSKVTYIVVCLFLTDPCKCYHRQNKSISEMHSCIVVTVWELQTANNRNQRNQV